MQATLLYEHPRAGFTHEMVVKAHAAWKEKLANGEAIIVKRDIMELGHFPSKQVPSFQVTNVWLEEQGGIIRLVGELKDLGSGDDMIKLECSIGVRK